MSPLSSTYLDEDGLDHKKSNSVMLGLHVCCLKTYLLTREVPSLEALRPTRDACTLAIIFKIAIKALLIRALGGEDDVESDDS
jgi:hypothetical protein